MSNPLTSFVTALRAAMAEDQEFLPEISEEAVVLVEDLDETGGTIANQISTAIRKAKGLGVLIYDRRGKIPQPDNARLRANVTMRVQLYISPAKYGRHSEATSSDELLSNMMKFLHHLYVDDAAHCYDALKVTDFYQVEDPDNIVWEILIAQSLLF